MPSQQVWGVRMMAVLTCVYYCSIDVVMCFYISYSPPA